MIRPWACRTRPVRRPATAPHMLELVPGRRRRGGAQPVGVVSGLVASKPLRRPGGRLRRRRSAHPGVVPGATGMLDGAVTRSRRPSRRSPPTRCCGHGRRQQEESCGATRGRPRGTGWWRSTRDSCGAGPRRPARSGRNGPHPRRAGRARIPNRSGWLAEQLEQNPVDEAVERDAPFGERRWLVRRASRRRSPSGWCCASAIRTSPRRTDARPEGTRRRSAEHLSRRNLSSPTYLAIGDEGRGRDGRGAGGGSTARSTGSLGSCYSAVESSASAGHASASPAASRSGTRHPESSFLTTLSTASVVDFVVRTRGGVGTGERAPGSGPR